MKSKVIAISAISAGLTAICLTVGIYIEMADMLALIIASSFVILPLYYKSYKGSVLASLAGGVIATVFGGFNFLSLVIPSFFFFFGIYPILSCFLKGKGLKKPIYFLIGAIWCVAYFYGAYFYYTAVMGLTFADFPEWLNWLNDYILYFLGAFGIVFYFVYDRFVTVVRILTDKFLGRIIK